MIDLGIVIGRLALALVCGAVIGVERQWRHKNAGIKTNTLVALGAAGFSIISNTFGDTNHNPAQIAAAVVSGIGFIGAGVIIHRGATVQGVTTAATLWATASMGVAIGIGQYGVGLVVFGGIVFSQIMLRHAGVVITKMRRRGDMPGRFEVRVDCPAESLTAINAAWTDYAAAAKLQALRRGTHRKGELMTWRAVFVTVGSAPIDLTTFEERLVRIEGVENVETRHLGMDDEA